MSYILDALKKAERERGITRMPSLTAAREPGAAGRSWLAAVSGVLFVGVVVALLFILSNPGKPPTPSPSAATQNRPAARAGAEEAGQAASVRPAPAPVGQSPHTDDTRGSGTSATRSGSGLTAASRTDGESIPLGPGAQKPPGNEPTASRSVPAESRSQVSPAEPAVAPPPQPAVDTAGAPAGQVVPAPGEIQAKPPSLKEAMSRMTLNILVYDDSEAARRVVINGRKYVKGDYVDGHYLVESITLEGAVLTYDGERALLRPR